MFEEELEEKVQLIQYECPSCNTKFSTNEKNKFNKCIFCGSEDLNSKEMTASTNVKIVLFRKEYKDVVSDYNKKIKLNPLVPFQFKKRKNFASLQKVYVPVFLTNISSKGDVEFIGGEKGSIAKDSIIETKKYDVVQKVKLNYDDVLLKISSKVNDDLFSTINGYDFFDIKSLDSQYFDESFYLSEDISLNDISVNAKDDVSKHAMNIIKNNVKHSLKKLKENNMVVKFENTREILLPIYIMNIKYKDKDYSYIMNGQTGKSCMNVPIGKLETIIFSVVCFIIVFILSFLIAYFL